MRDQFTFGAIPGEPIKAKSSAKFSRFVEKSYQSENKICQTFPVM